MIEGTIQCVQCGTVHTIQVPEEDYQAYQAGKHVQDCFPYLDPGVREMLISGICPECWDKLFPDEEDE